MGTAQPARLNRRYGDVRVPLDDVRGYRIHRRLRWLVRHEVRVVRFGGSAKEATIATLTGWSGERLERDALVVIRKDQLKFCGFRS